MDFKKLLQIKNKGFSLVEIAISLVVISIALLSFTQIFNVNKGQIKASRDYTTAIMIANETIQKCKAFDFTFLDEDDKISNEEKKKTLEYDFNNDNNSAGKIDPIKPFIKLNNIEFSRYVNIYSPILLEPNFKIVEVEIKWKKVTKREKETEIESSDYNVYNITTGIFKKN